jgi:hypothetical protein
MQTIKICKSGRDLLVNEGIVEVASLRTLPTGRFEVRVHGVSWLKGMMPSINHGTPQLECESRELALIRMGQAIEWFSAQPAHLVSRPGEK